MKSKRAITLEQKRAIIERLLQVWLKNPELRLGQLIWNKTCNSDFFYDEDEDFMKLLENETRNTNSPE